MSQTLSDDLPSLLLSLAAGTRVLTFPSVRALTAAPAPAPAAPSEEVFAQPEGLDPDDVLDLTFAVETGVEPASPVAEREVTVEERAIVGDDLDGLASAPEAPEAGEPVSPFGPAPEPLADVVAGEDRVAEDYVAEYLADAAAVRAQVAAGDDGWGEDWTAPTAPAAAADPVVEDAEGTPVTDAPDDQLPAAEVVVEPSAPILAEVVAEAVPGPGLVVEVAPALGVEPDLVSFDPAAYLMAGAQAAFAVPAVVPAPASPASPPVPDDEPATVEVAAAESSPAVDSRRKALQMLRELGTLAP